MKSSLIRIGFYVLAIICGIGVGLYPIKYLSDFAAFCSEAFIRLFRCVSAPIISLSIIIAMKRLWENKSMGTIWKRTFSYTISTTLLAVTISAIIYYFTTPAKIQISNLNAENIKAIASSDNYLTHVLQTIPDNIVGVFLKNQVLAILLLSVAIGIAMHFIPNEEARKTIQNFFEGLHSILSTLIKWIVTILPIGLFGFISVGINELNASTSLQGMSAYFFVILVSNLLQGIVILPLFLLWKRQHPITVFRKMLPALSVAFFTKSSVGTLPITLRQIETKLKVDTQVSRFVLPLCTTINMNGCGVFIFTTVIYVMYNYGIDITLGLMINWILITTLAAIGNAGVPMGCFFLSISLLSSMNIPIELMGLILPIYNVIDMFETALNVWSDSCIAVAVNQDVNPLNKNS